MNDILNDALQTSVLTSKLDDIVAYFIVDMCHTDDEEYNKVSKWHA